MVSPPPRASTIGSVRAIAAPEEPTTTAPPRQAPHSAPHTGGVLQDTAQMHR